MKMESLADMSDKAWFGDLTEHSLQGEEGIFNQAQFIPRIQRRYGTIGILHLYEYRSSQSRRFKSRVS
jgi:hypothetical protein